MYHVQASQNIPEIYIIFWFCKVLYTLLFQIIPFGTENNENAPISTINLQSQKSLETKVNKSEILEKLLSRNFASVSNA